MESKESKESKDRKESLEAVKYQPDPLSKIKTLVHQFDKKANPYELYGYIFYDEWHGFFTHHGGDKSKRKIKYPGDYRGKDFDSVLYSLQDDLEKGYRLERELVGRRERKLTKEEQQILRDMEHAQKILEQEYKLHLMPKEDYIIPVAQKIFEACMKDRDLRALIASIKFGSGKKDKSGQIFPNIVIYPKLGRANFIKLLQKMATLFDPYNLSDIGTGTIPRYSLPIDMPDGKPNPLICYAQGGGDLKNEILKEFPEKEAEFVTIRRVHYAWSEPLTLSAILERKKENEKDEQEEKSAIEMMNAYMEGRSLIPPDWSAPEIAVTRVMDDRPLTDVSSGRTGRKRKP